MKVMHDAVIGYGEKIAMTKDEVLESFCTRRHCEQHARWWVMRRGTRSDFFDARCDEHAKVS